MDTSLHLIVGKYAHANGVHLFWAIYSQVWTIDNYWKKFISLNVCDLLFINLLCMVCKSGYDLLGMRFKFYFLFIIKPSSFPNLHNLTSTKFPQTLIPLLCCVNMFMSLKRWFYLTQDAALSTWKLIEISVLILRQWI